MVAADDKEDEDDEVDRGEEVRQGDGPPVVAEELCEHCTMQSCTIAQCTLDKSSMQTTVKMCEQCCSLGYHQDWQEEQRAESGRSYF